MSVSYGNLVRRADGQLSSDVFDSYEYGNSAEQAEGQPSSESLDRSTYSYGDTAEPVPDTNYSYGNSVEEAPDPEYSYLNTGYPYGNSVEQAEEQLHSDNFDPFYPAEQAERRLPFESLDRYTYGDAHSVKQRYLESSDRCEEPIEYPKRESHNYRQSRKRAEAKVRPVKFNNRETNTSTGETEAVKALHREDEHPTKSDNRETNTSSEKKKAMEALHHENNRPTKSDNRETSTLSGEKEAVEALRREVDRPVPRSERSDSRLDDARPPEQNPGLGDQAPYFASATLLIVFVSGGFYYRVVAVSVSILWVYCVHAFRSPLRIGNGDILTTVMGVAKLLGLLILVAWCVMLSPIHILLPTALDAWTKYAEHPPFRTWEVLHEPDNPLIE
jgi:hypothetical protein